MSSAILQGSASGSGSITLLAPVTNSNQTISLPDVTGTMLTNKSTGTVLQIVQATQGTQVTSNSSTPIDSNLSASITPSSASNKILVTVSQPFQAYTTTTGRDETAYYWYIYRNAVLLNTGRYWIGISSLSNNKTIFGTVNYTYLDSPATTSSVTYKTQFNAYDTSQAAVANIYSSTIILQEIVG